MCVYVGERYFVKHKAKISSRKLSEDKNVIY